MRNAFIACYIWAGVTTAGGFSMIPAGKDASPIMYICVAALWPIDGAVFTVRYLFDMDEGGK